MGNRVVCVLPVSTIVMLGTNIDVVMNSFWSCSPETLEN